METQMIMNREDHGEAKTALKAMPLCASLVTTGEEAKPDIVDVNECIGLLARSLGPAEKRRIQIVLRSDPLPIAGDKSQITAVLFALFESANRVAPGGNITILTTLLPIDASCVSTGRESGCLFVSISGSAGRDERIDDLGVSRHEETRCALLAVRNAIEGQNGCFRILHSPSTIAFNVYLPVARYIL